YRVPNPWIRLDWSVEGDDESLRDPLIVEWVALRPERISNDELHGRLYTTLRDDASWEIVVDHPDIVLFRRSP
ncbi:MAG: hypothetical protein HKN01_01760, partial [Acidimicrobiia bacterium]|nr:hypothetical protein [Acidimicrobiia bacterium]